MHFYDLCLPSVFGSGGTIKDACYLKCDNCGFKASDKETKQLIGKNFDMCKNKIIETLIKFKFLRNSNTCIVCGEQLSSSKYVCNKCLRNKFQTLYKNIIDPDLVSFVADLFSTKASLLQISENEFGPNFEKRKTYKSECCNPQKGDEIVAFKKILEFSSGLKVPIFIIHKADCSYVPYFDKKQKVELKD